MISQLNQALLEGLEVQFLAQFKGQRSAQNEFGRRYLLHQGIHRQQKHRAAAQRRQRGETAQALGNDILMRRKIIVGQGFQIGKIQNLQAVIMKEADFLL